MAELVTYPNTILRQTSVEVLFPVDLTHIVDNMFDIMYKYDGVGLSAIQIGHTLRLIVADVGEGKEIYVNPKIVRLGGTQRYVIEGCLSFPDVFERIKRWNKITISYQDIEGNQKVLNTGGLRAHMLQHELEHLDGILLCDKGLEAI